MEVEYQHAVLFSVLQSPSESTRSHEEAMWLILPVVKSLTLEMFSDC